MNGPSYFEIQVEDIARAKNFYEQVFGWKFFNQEGLGIEYWRIETEGPRGGMLKRPVAAPAGMSGGTNAFTCSMEVSGFDGVSEKILNLGGRVALPKFPIPGKCWQGYFLDTEGNTFGIFEVDENAK